MTKSKPLYMLHWFSSARWMTKWVPEWPLYKIIYFQEQNKVLGLSAISMVDSVGLLMQLFSLIINCILVQFIQSQTIVLNFTQQSVTIYQNQQINSSFVVIDNVLDCTTNLYSYDQSEQDYITSAPTQILINNNIKSLSISVSTVYGNFQPTLSSNTCNSTNCIVDIQNNCPSVLSNENYFDVIKISIEPVGTFWYELNCNIKYNATFFEYSGLILIFCATLILMGATNMGRWNSFSGFGIEYGYKMVILVSSSILTFGLLTLYEPKAATVILNMANIISIVLSVSIMSIQALYSFKIKRLQRRLQFFRKVQVRIIDILGVLISIPVVVGWWASGRNWIFSDILSVILIVSIIKVFKFVSFKVALIAYFIIVTLYCSSTIIIALKYQNQFSHAYINQANTPYQFQIPLIKPAYAQKCTWISITTIAFPGLLVSYLRRFDQSRSTRIYLVTAVSTYFLGSLIWWVSDTFSYFPLPFDAFCQPIMIIAFTMFAFKRKELRTLWEGKFFDEEFHNKNEIDALGQRIAEQTNTNNIKQQFQLGQNIFFNMEDDSDLDANERLPPISDQK